MSKADQFRQYAEEAMRWAHKSKTEVEKAHKSKTEEEKQALMDICAYMDASRGAQRTIC
jgi:hypothetical protein